MHRKSALLLFLAVLGLLAIGIVILFSTSAYAVQSKGDVYRLVKQQSIWLAVGLVGCSVAAFTDYHFWQRTWWIWLGLTVVMLVLCFIPPIGIKINGSRRWIGIPAFRFQPSEVAKIAAVFFLAWWFAKYEKASGKLLHGFLIPVAVVAVVMALIAPEVDLGATALIGATSFTIMFIAGSNLFVLGVISIGGLAAMFAAAMTMHERMARLMAFMDLERYKEGAGLQQWEALIAFGSGGIEGLGLGNGRQKMHYLPFAHTDFIFPMIGEELGLRVTLLVIFLFVVIVVCGLTIALHAKDRFGLLLGSGAVSLLALQAAVNIGVTTSLLPNKGMGLPFISYGGTNLALCLFCVGILLSIYRRGNLEPSLNTRHSALQVRATPRI